MSLAAVNQNCVVHEEYERLRKSTDSLKVCFENVNTLLYSPKTVFVPANSVDTDEILHSVASFLGLHLIGL